MRRRQTKFKTHCKFRYQDAEVLFKNKEILTEYQDFENSRDVAGMSRFSKNERLVLFLHYRLEWGRRMIRNVSGLSEMFVRGVLKKVKENN